MFRRPARSATPFRRIAAYRSSDVLSSCNVSLARTKLKEATRRRCDSSCFPSPRNPDFQNVQLQPLSSEAQSRAVRGCIRLHADCLTPSHYPLGLRAYEEDDKKWCTRYVTFGRTKADQIYDPLTYSTHAGNIHRRNQFQS